MDPPPAIRARLSTEDSTTDASDDDDSGDSSGYSSGVDVVKEEEEEEDDSYESAVDDAASLRRLSMPKARITGDDEDDFDDEMFDADADEAEKERILKLGMDYSDRETSDGGDYVGLGDGFVSGKEESLFSNGSDEEEDDIARIEVPLIASMEGLPRDDLENEGGLEFNDVKLEKEDPDSIADLRDQIEAVSDGVVNGSNDLSGGGGYEDFGDGFGSGKEESVISNGGGEEDDIAGDEAPLLASMEELQHAALENEGDVKLVMNVSDVVELEVEEHGDSAADLHDQIEAVSSMVVDQSKELSVGGYEDFGDGLVFRKEESMFSNGSGDEDDTDGGEAPLMASMEQLQHVALDNEDGLDFNDVKLVMNVSDVVELEVEEDRDSIADLHDQIEDVSSTNVEQSGKLFGGDYEDFGAGFGKEEGVFSNGRDEDDDIISDESPFIPSIDKLQHDALENEGSLEFNDVQLEMNGRSVVELEVEEDPDSIADPHDQIEAVSSRNVEQSNDDLSGGVYESFGDGFVSGKLECVFSNGSNEEDDAAGHEFPLIPSTEELQNVALETEGGLEFNNLKLEMNDSDVVELEVEDLDSIADVYDQIEGVSSGVVGQRNDSVLELQDLVVESAIVGTEMNNISDNTDATKKSITKAVKTEAEEAKSSQLEHVSSEFKGFETINAVDFVSDQIPSPIALTYSKTFEPRSPEECADNIKAEKDNACSLDSGEVNHTADEILERCYPTVEVSAEFLDNFEEEEDDSRAIVTQVSMTDNSNGCEYSKSESRFDSFHVAYDQGSGEEDNLVILEWPVRDASIENTYIMKHILKVMEESSSSSHSVYESSLKHSCVLDDQIISGSDEEAKIEDDGYSKELFDTSVLAALLRTPTDASKRVPQNPSSIFSIKHSAGLKSAPSFLIPASHSVSIITSSMNNEAKMLTSKVGELRLKYLHLVRRLGHFASDPLPAHVLYRLGLVDGAKGGRQISKKLKKFEEDSAFSCNILVLGKTGVGKSSAINSIFAEERASTDPFQPATASVREISGVVDGVYISLIDMPGLLTSLNDQRSNRKILLSVKKYIQRSPPDVVMYVDRLDTYAREFDDDPILRTITSILGSSIWNNAIITLTHAASTTSDGPDGSLLSYEAVVAQRALHIQRSIQRAAGDIHLMNPVALVENHFSCSRSIDREILLPNGLRWRPWLLLLCCSSKILTEVDTILESESSSVQKLLPSYSRSILSSLLKSKVQFKLFRNQGEEDYDFDIALKRMTNEMPEEDDECELQKLANEQKSAYLVKKLERLDREKGGSDENVNIDERFEPLLFHNENSLYSCHFMERKSQVLTRPDGYIHYQDRDPDYDGWIIKESFDIGRPFLISLAVQITKDKNEFLMYPGCSLIASEHGETGSTLANFNIQFVRKKLDYTLQGETKLLDSKKNKIAAGILVTFFDETLVNGFKLKDRIFHGKKMPLVASIGVVRAERNVAYGASLEFRLMEKCSSVKRPSVRGLFVDKWRDFAVGTTLESEFSTGRNARISVRCGVNDRNTWRISIKTSTGKQVHVALLGLFTIVLSICRSIWSSEANL